MNRQLITKPGALQAPQLDYFLLDGSGSMISNWQPTMAAMDNFCKVLASQNIHSHGILQVFSDFGNLSLIERDAVLADWPPFYSSPISCPGGMTPLFDAINLMCRALKELDPPKASIVICTDGDENASEHTGPAQARALLAWCRAKGWQVTFLGCNFDNAKQARLLGANEENSIGVRKELLAEAGKLLGDKRARHARTDEDINFSSDERRKFGGYLTGPTGA